MIKIDKKMGLSEIEIKKYLLSLSSNVDVRVVDECSSTNDVASSMLNSVDLPFALLACRQISGRGRMSRAWYASEGASICLSVAVDMRGACADVLASSTVRVGIEVCNALNEIAKEKMFLKWPNDIYSSSGKKIAGMLAELKQIGGSYKMIFGIGVNYDLSLSDIPLPDDIVNIVDSVRPKLIVDKSINELTAIIIKATVKALSSYDLPLPNKFKQIDWLENKTVDISIGNRNYSGIACGINELGNLLVRLSDGSFEIVNSGEATLHKS